VLEFLIVFLGVYLGFLYQEYGEDRDLAVERDKILVGSRKIWSTFACSFRPLPPACGSRWSDGIP
jgi:hypothetical protein